jgi:hypothetical protein
MNIYVKNLPIGYDLRKYQLYTMGGSFVFVIPNVFPSNSQGVPQDVPNNKSILTHIV